MRACVYGCMYVCMYLCLPLDLGQPRAGIGAVLRVGVPSSCVHPPHLTNFGPFLGHEWLTKTRTVLQYWRVTGGPRALNQGNILPSLPQTPHGLSAPSAPLPPLIVGPAPLAQGEPQGLGDRAREGKVPLPLVKTSLPELASPHPAPYPHTNQGRLKLKLT